MQRVIFLSFFLLLLHLTAFTQLRVHVSAGFANYKGDLQEKEITMQHANYVTTVGGTFHILKKLALRGEVSNTKFSAYDRENRDKYLRKRNLSFQTNIYEAALMLEYDFFNLENFKLSPFIFAGIGKFKFNPYTTDSVGSKVYLQPLSTEGQGLPQYPNRKVYKLSQYNIPWGFGVKYPLSEYVYVSAEFGSRKLFTDYLDDVSKTYVDKDVLLNAKGPTAIEYAFRGDEIKNSSFRTYPKDGLQRGNLHKDDNYYFFELRLSIRLPWFETGDIEVNGNGKRKNSTKTLRCPIW